MIVVPVCADHGRLNVVNLVRGNANGRSVLVPLLVLGPSPCWAHMTTGRG